MVAGVPLASRLSNVAVGYVAHRAMILLVLKYPAPVKDRNRRDVGAVVVIDSYTTEDYSVTYNYTILLSSRCVVCPSSVDSVGVPKLVKAAQIGPC